MYTEVVPARAERLIGLVSGLRKATHKIYPLKSQSRRVVASSEKSGTFHVDLDTKRQTDFS